MRAAITLLAVFQFATLACSGAQKPIFLPKLPINVFASWSGAAHALTGPVPSLQPTTGFIACPDSVPACIDFASQLDVRGGLLVLGMDAPGRCATLAANPHLQGELPTAWARCQTPEPGGWFCCGTPELVTFPPDQRPALLLRYPAPATGAARSAVPWTRPSDGSLGVDARQFGCKSERLRLNVVIPATVHSGGPRKVESGLLNGLRLLGVNFSTNAADFENYDVVYIYSYSPPVKKDFTDAMRSSKAPLLVGPCIDQNAFPVEALKEAKRVWYLGASYWATIRHADVLRGKLPKMEYSRHAAGIDTRLFAPDPAVSPSQVLLYVKSCAWTVEQEQALTAALAEVWPQANKVAKLGYGGYKEEDFIVEAQKSAFGVLCGRDETQGVALMEMMSIGVPLIVYRGNGNHAPYLCDECGVFYNSADEFRAKIRDFTMLVKNGAFNPRRYIEQMHSLEQAGRQFLRVACAISGV